jgi:hypothetical protein
MTNDIRCDVFSERLADLLEHDVDEATRMTLESHALACGDCGALLADLRKLRIDAASLPLLAPGRDLWEGISQRIDAPVIPLRAGDAGLATHRTGGWRRWSPMVAAAVLLIALTSISTYVVTIRSQSVSATSIAANEPSSVRDSARQPAEPAPIPAIATPENADGRPREAKQAASAAGTAVAPTVRFVNVKRSAEQVYDSEIARLRTIVDRRRGQLDPVTISVIERNLKVIDEAIAQCKLALAKDPASRFLIESLNSALETKVELLRTATMLPARS